MNGALFDLDGVIADTAKYHYGAWNALIQKHFKKSLPLELESRTKGVSREDSLQIILDFLEIEVSDEEFQKLTIEKNSLYLKSLENLTSEDILPGIYQLILDLKSEGYKIALASASKNGAFILERLGISHLFDVVVNPESVSAGKPAPDIFLAAAKAIQTSIEDCIGFEDSVAGIQAINSAGALSIGIGSESELSQANIRYDSTEQINCLQLFQILE
ncbi:TPA: beta-phosphoglucomutase [Streptococcus suis]|nr:beta-phosphoglucomutase [Streptococcus suis]